MRFIPVLVILSLSASGQTGNIKASISNIKTSQHVNVPGTNAFIIPPAGYTVSAKIPGFQKGANHILTIRDSVGDNIYAYDLPALKQTLTRMGAKILEEKTIKVQQFAAKYFVMQASPNTNSHMLIFGDSTFCTQITTVYPITEPAAGQELLNALNTIHYTKQRAIYPMDTSGFNLDENITRFKYFGFSTRGNVYAFFVNGKEDDMRSGQPFVLVSRLNMNKLPSVTDLPQLKTITADKYGLTGILEKNTGALTVNGYKAVQSELTGKISGQDAIVYNCFITDGRKIFLFQGVSRQDVTNSLAEFKKLLGSIKIW